MPRRPLPRAKRKSITSTERDSWLLGPVERRKPENATVRRWVGLGDQVLGITQTRREAVRLRKTAKDMVKGARELRSTVQETKQKARKLMGTQ